MDGAEESGPAPFSSSSLSSSSKHRTRSWRSSGLLVEAGLEDASVWIRGSRCWLGRGDGSFAADRERLNAACKHTHRHQQGMDTVLQPSLSVTVRGVLIDTGGAAPPVQHLLTVGAPQGELRGEGGVLGQKLGQLCLRTERALPTTDKKFKNKSKALRRGSICRGFNGVNNKQGQGRAES